MAVHLKSTGIDYADYQTPAAGMASELFDHYEEGSWTPGNQGTGWGSNAGDSSYICAGKMVFVECYLQITSSTGTGMKISALPFASGAGTYCTSTGVDTGNAGPATSYHFRLDGGNSNMTLLNAEGNQIASDEYDATHVIFGLTYSK